MRTKTSASFARQRPEDLFSSSPLCSRVICYFRLKRTIFVFFTPFFYPCFQGKKSRYDCNNVLFGWHNSRRRLDDFWWVGSPKLTFVNLVLVKSRWAGLTSGWATIVVLLCCMPREVRLSLYSTFAPPTSAIVGGLSFSRSQNCVVGEFPPALHVTDNFACGLLASKKTRIRLLFVSFSI